MRIAGRAAALCTLAAVIFGGVLAAQRQTGRPELVIEVLARQEDTMTAAAAGERPSVLIYHTHTWEAYEMTETARYEMTETWRTRDEAHNMIRVGRELTEELTARGFDVVHDTTAFEPPKLADAYTRSLAMLEARRDAGERYDYYIDVHRDAYSGLYNGANTVMIDGKEAAYVMLLVGKGTGATGSGFDERPDWPRNLELAQQITDTVNGMTPGAARGVKIKTGRFNQHISTGALLLEVGNNMNTLEQALAACPSVAEAIARVHSGGMNGE